MLRVRCRLGRGLPALALSEVQAVCSMYKSMRVLEGGEMGWWSSERRLLQLSSGWSSCTSTLVGTPTKAGGVSPTSVTVTRKRKEALRTVPKSSAPSCMRCGSLNRGAGVGWGAGVKGPARCQGWPPQPVSLACIFSDGLS